jgi:hypothetical protein
VVYDRPSEVGAADAGDRRAHAAVAESADERPPQVECLDQGDDIVRKLRVGDRPAGMDGSTRPPSVRREDAEALREDVDERGVCGGIAGPDRAT